MLRLSFSLPSCLLKMSRKKFRTFVSDMCYIYYGVRQLRKKSLANES